MVTSLKQNPTLNWIITVVYTGFITDLDLVPTCNSFEQHVLARHGKVGCLVQVMIKVDFFPVFDDSKQAKANHRYMSIKGFTILNKLSCHKEHSIITKWTKFSPIINYK